MAGRCLNLISGHARSSVSTCICPFCFFPTAGKAPQEVENQFFPEGNHVKVEFWIKGLEVPWSLVFLPGGRALVSERPGRIRLIKDGRLRETPYALLEVTPCYISPKK